MPHGHAHGAHGAHRCHASHTRHTAHVASCATSNSNQDPRATNAQRFTHHTPHCTTLLHAHRTQPRQPPHDRHPKYNIVHERVHELSVGIADRSSVVPSLYVQTDHACSHPWWRAPRERALPGAPTAGVGGAPSRPSSSHAGSGERSSRRQGPGSARRGRIKNSIDVRYTRTVNHRSRAPDALMRIAHSARGRSVGASTTTITDDNVRSRSVNRNMYSVKRTTINGDAGALHTRTPHSELFGARATLVN